MLHDILRISSVVPHGIGGVHAGAIDLMYNFLLRAFDSKVYSFILINQVGEDLQEFIRKDGKGIVINIRYPVEDFEKKTLYEQNLIRLDVVHTALVRIARQEKKLEIDKLEKIRAEIITKEFQFDFIYKQFKFKQGDLTGAIRIRPASEKFSFYFYTEMDGKPVSNILLYEGKCTTAYIDQIFHTGRWLNPDEFLIKDKNKEFELRVYVRENRTELTNLTKYRNPPYFEGMKAGGFNQQAYKDWASSLPPDIGGAIDLQQN